MSRLKLYSHVFCLVSAVMLRPTAVEAALISLLPTSLGTATDNAPLGTFDSLNTTNLEAASGGSNLINRGLVEFDLLALPDSAFVLAASFVWTQGNATNPPNPVEFHGYVGNGIVELVDATFDNLISAFVVPQVPSGGPISLSVPVTSFIQSLGVSSARFAGLMLRSSLEGASQTQAAQFRNPRLDISFQIVAVPEPATLTLFVLGLAWLNIMRRWHAK